MSSKPPLITPDDFLDQRMSRKTQAGLQQFIKLWQSSKSLRLLIGQIVANAHRNTEEEKSTTRYRNLQNKDSTQPLPNRKTAHSLTEKRAISTSFIEGHIQSSHGGLSRMQVLALLEKFKAGNRNLGTYMLVREWKRYSEGKDTEPDFRIEQFTLDKFSKAICENRADFFEEIAETLRFLEKEEYIDKGNWKHDPGHWWQFHLLLYVLEHPQEKYAMREFVKYFREEVGENEMPTTKTIRSFCRTNGIVLDSRPGAPKKSKTE